MKKSIGIISQRSGMADFYGKLLTRLFGDVADISMYDLEHRTIQGLRECDLYLNTSTSYDLMRNNWAKTYLAPPSQIVQSDITFTKRAVDRTACVQCLTRTVFPNQPLRPSPVAEHAGCGAGHHSDAPANPRPVPGGFCPAAAV